jgi:acylphosphatase
MKGETIHMSRHVRARVIIIGKVQGVYFRAETQMAAEQKNVYGWVRNRPDGSVEALFEGDEPSVESMLEWCRQGSLYSRVHHVDVRWETYTGEFQRFDITR